MNYSRFSKILQAGAAALAVTAITVCSIPVRGVEIDATGQERGYVQRILTYASAQTQERIDNERLLERQIVKMEKLAALRNRPTKRYLGTFKITGYDPWCRHCCGKVEAVVGTTIAMKDLEYGTRVYIEGLGEYIVQDRGVGTGVIDVACSSHADCYAITGNYDVYIVEEE